MGSGAPRKINFNQWGFYSFACFLTHLRKSPQFHLTLLNILITMHAFT
ncbi:hypothetical protein BCE_3300 [Bacillus cereus ATCC 10987]|uniref:Uncharacterized protein n=1 Tax=Bacillus cereus (strain ATCC 10987 / NRS 248) TaxID=222523 RepID=Q734V4_BACC1|nr:hypothetical protein BCE_3300 [Bacillus cereus ATCC 10987]